MSEVTISVRLWRNAVSLLSCPPPPPTHTHTHTHMHWQYYSYNYRDLSSQCSLWRLFTFEYKYSSPFVLQLKSLTHLPSFLYSALQTSLLYIFTLSAPIFILLSFLIFTPAFVYWFACFSKKLPPPFPESAPYFHQFALLVCVLWKWIGEWGAGDLFVPRSGTYHTYSSVPFTFFCFGREGEDRGCPYDEEGVNGLEVRSGLWGGEETVHSQL